MTNATYTISQSPEWRLQIISFARPRVFQTQRCIYNSHIRRREGEHFTLEKLEPKIEWKSCQWKDLGSVLFLIFFFFFLPLPHVFVSPCPLRPETQPSDALIRHQLSSVTFPVWRLNLWWFLSWQSWTFITMWFSVYLTETKSKDAND